jgi:hypothetical protein
MANRLSNFLPLPEGFLEWAGRWRSRIVGPDPSRALENGLPFQVLTELLERVIAIVVTLHREVLLVPFQDKINLIGSYSGPKYTRKQCTAAQEQERTCRRK